MHKDQKSVTSYEKGREIIFGAKIYVRTSSVIKEIYLQSYQGHQGYLQGKLRQLSRFCWQEDLRISTLQYQKPQPAIVDSRNDTPWLLSRKSLKAGHSAEANHT